LNGFSSRDVWRGAIREFKELELRVCRIGIWEFRLEAIWAICRCFSIGEIRVGVYGLF